MELGRTGKIVKNTYTGMLLRVITLLTQFVTRTVLIYTLGEQYTGVSAVFSSVLSVLSLSELGIGSAISFALYEPLNQKNYAKD